MTAAPSKDLPVSKHFTGDIRETKKPMRPLKITGSMTTELLQGNKNESSQ
jgi:hypothetical protein